MKIFSAIALAAAIFTVFLSCQKEIGFDANGKSIGTFLKDAGGDCSPVNVNGIFKQDTVLALDVNYVDVQVNVTTPGTFDIKSDTVNGYYFSKTGTVAFGNNTIRLFASGKPVAADVTNTFTITYGTSTCSFDITVAPLGVVPAVFTLGSLAGICTQAIPGGTFIAGVALTPANTLTVQVNVTTVGTYILGAASTNGFLFSGTGTFTAPGLQTVTLTGLGTPIKAETSVVTVTNISSTCTHAITVEPPVPPAVYTLDGTPNACTGVIVNGTYAATVAMAATNTATLKVNVTTAGTYTITTNTVNGISFNNTGVFTTTGAQTVVLTATGTPETASLSVFKPNVTAGSCNFSVTVLSAPPPATFTLSSATGACTPITVNGTYTIGMALGASNTAVVQVNVLTTGRYTLTTNTDNGITFSQSGLFTATGLQNVILQGTGTPATAVTSTFIPQAGASSCTFNVVAKATPTGIFTCKIDGVPTAFNEDAHAAITYDLLGTTETSLVLTGQKLPRGNPSDYYSLYINKPGGGLIPVGGYNENTYVNSGGVYKLSMDYFIYSSTIHWTVTDNIPFIAPNPAFKITITSITATRYKGTFSGTVKENFGVGTGTKLITEGVFDLPIQ
jgi:hypothetical protein